MLKYIKQDVTMLTEGIVCHGVNERKKMGSGIALAIRNKWPEVYDRYMDHCHPKHHGQADIIQIDDNLYVANCYTQRSYGYDNQQYADPEAIRTSLHQVCNFVTLLENDLNIYMPKIGCGLGGLDWEKDVKHIVEEISQKHLIPIYVCEL